MASRIRGITVEIAAISHKHHEWNPYHLQANRPMTAVSTSNDTTASTSRGPNRKKNERWNSQIMFAF